MQTTLKLPSFGDCIYGAFCNNYGVNVPGFQSLDKHWIEYFSKEVKALPDGCTCSQSLCNAASTHSHEIYQFFSIVYSAEIYYPTERKFSLEFQFCYFANGKFAKF